MPDALSEARWAGIRAILEGQPPTQERVARATGVYVKTIARRAGQEKWKTLDFRHKRVRTAWLEMIALAGFARDGEELDPVRGEEAEDFAAQSAAEVAEAGEGEAEPWPDEPPAARLARIGAVLTRRMEVMLRRMEAGHPPESRQVTALSNLMTLSERLATMAREEETAAARPSDAEVAAALEKIDRRIHELAVEYSRHLVHALLVDRFGMAPDEVEAGLAETEPPADT